MRSGERDREGQYSLISALVCAVVKCTSLMLAEKAAIDTGPIEQEVWWMIDSVSCLGPLSDLLCVENGFPVQITAGWGVRQERLLQARATSRASVLPSTYVNACCYLGTMSGVLTYLPAYLRRSQMTSPVHEVTPAETWWTQ